MEPDGLPSMGSHRIRHDWSDSAAAAAAAELIQVFPGGSVVKNPPAKAGNTGSIPGSGRSPGEGNGNPFQCSCLGSPMDRGAWRATVSRGCKESSQQDHVPACGCCPCVPLVDPDVDPTDFLFFPSTFLGSRCVHCSLKRASSSLTSKPREIPWEKANSLHLCFYSSLVGMPSFHGVFPLGQGQAESVF